MEKVIIYSEFIKLDQLLKWLGLVDCGAKAKQIILESQVKVNEKIETRRGRKIYTGYIVEFQNKKFLIEYLSEKKIES